MHVHGTNGRVPKQPNMDICKYYNGWIRKDAPWTNSRAALRQAVGIWKPCNGLEPMSTHGMNGRVPWMPSMSI